MKREHAHAKDVENAYGLVKAFGWLGGVIVGIAVGDRIGWSSHDGPVWYECLALMIASGIAFYLVFSWIGRRVLRPALDRLLPSEPEPPQPRYPRRNNDR